MSDPTESGIARFAPYLLLVGLATLTVRAGLQPVTNADTLFHLRFGHEFLGPWSLREPGSVSSLATAPWTPTQRLPQVVMARAEDWFGLGGVAWLTAAQITGFVLAVLVACRHRSSLLVATTVTLVTVVVAGGGLSGRPQVISYLLTAVTVDAWLRTREDQRRAVVAGPVDLGVGPVPRHVAAGPGDRGRRHRRRTPGPDLLRCGRPAGRLSSWGAHWSSRD